MGLAEFSLSKSSEINSYYTYGLVRVLVTNPPEIIRNPRFKQEARNLLVNGGWEAFSAAYGWEYVEGFVTGGSYYALIEIQTDDEKEQRELRPN